MTRVSEAMWFDLARRGTARARSRLMAAQEHVATGLRISRPSDAPADVGRLRALDASLARLRAGETAAARAGALLQATESGLGEAANLIDRARDVALAAANAPLSAADRVAAAEEIAGIRAQLLQIANGEVGGVHLFSGFRTAAAPFLPDGTYVGDDGAREIEALPGMRVTINVTGAQAFGAAGGTDIFALLAGLETDLRANDVAAVAARLPDLDAAGGQIRRARVAAGVQIDQLETAATARADALFLAYQARSGVRDADVARAMTDMMQAEQALRAALAVAARIPSLGATET